MTTVQDVLDFLQTLAPQYMKMDWDNVGLLCGRPDREVRRILVALDPFEAVCREAADWQASGDAPPSDFSAASQRHGRHFCGPVYFVFGRPGNRRGQCPYESGLRAGWSQRLPGPCLGPGAGGGAPSLRYGRPGPPLGPAPGRTDGAGFATEVCRVAVGGGACGDCVQEAHAAGCDTFVTADVKYNQFWDAKDLGINLVDAGHFWTENPVCLYLADKLRAAFPEIVVKVSENHTDCIRFC